ncbi:hypothetical protein GC163_10020 [bacterium]|nr:hypothetical protein [bacterium]
MAAASSKPTAVHYTLVAFLLIMIILGVMLYLTSQDAGKAKAALAAKEGELNQVNTALRKSDTDLEELKKILGKSQLQQVTNPANPRDPLSVVGSLMNDLDTYGKALAETTVAGTIAKLRQALDTANAELASKTDSLTSSENTVLALQGRYQTTVDEHQKARSDSESLTRTTINERDEQLQAKDLQISELTQVKNTVELELQQEKDAREADRVQSDNEINKLVLINDKLREELDEIKQESFEIADGRIRRVDNVSRIVWIDIGDADFLKPRQTFSIYGKDTPGVARTPADIKGKIEVTRIIDAHLAEAKMIEEDIYRPMSPGDFIYTPLWSPGRSEKFAVVGLLDLDGDGKSDRELFHQELAVRGAEIADEVDDDGVRTGSGIDEGIKYLVMGRVPDPGDLANLEDQQKAKEMSQVQAEMRKEARLYGVRIIPLNSFLDYIGYKPKRRLFRPGENRPYNLKAGAASASVNQPLGDITSSGQVSGSYGGSKLPPITSSGQTSKLFGGKP